LFVLPESGPEDDITCNDGVRCHYLRDVSGLQPSLNSHFHDQNLNLAQMLADFFQFYSHEFDYTRDAVCIVSGDIQPKRFASQVRFVDINYCFGIYKT
jgi:hypothetical protein